MDRETVDSLYKWTGWGERGEDMRGESTGKVRVREDSRVTGFGRTAKRGQK